MPAYKDKDKWRVTFYYDSCGQRKKKNKRGFDTKKNALEWEREFLSKTSGSEEMLFKSLCELYLEDCKIRQAQNTWINKIYKIKKWILPYFGKISVSEIDTMKVRTWQNRMVSMTSEGNVNAINILLKSIFEYGVKYKNFQSNPVKESIINKNIIRKEKQLLTEEDLEKILTEERNIVFQVAMKVLFWTGIRLGEMLALTFDDFDFEKRTMKINKSLNAYLKDKPISKTKTAKGNRTIHINDIVIESIQLLYEKELTNRPFSSITGTYVYTHIKRTAKRAGIEGVGVHTFRHSHASYLFSKGVNVLLISKRLGHSNISTTLDTYTHALKDMEDKMIEVLK